MVQQSKFSVRLVRRICWLWWVPIPPFFLRYSTSQEGAIEEARELAEKQGLDTAQVWAEITDLDTGTVVTYQRLGW